MAKKFLSNIELDAGLVDASNSLGSSGQILSSTGSTVSWVDNVVDSAASADKALSLTITVKNTESVALTKGQVVCAAPSATPPSGNVIEVKLADNNGTNSMPAIGILNEGLDAAGGTNDEGEAIMFGRISGIDTSAFSVGDEVFVSDTAGALTATKPTGVKYIQKVGVIMRDDASNGTIEIFGAGRTNDVPTPLYIDHDNQRVGIGITSPDQRLNVDAGATGINQGIPATSGTSQNGILRLTPGDLTYGETLDFGMNVGPTYAWIQATNKDGLNTNYSLALNPNGGNVGIGTTDPSSLLSVGSSAVHNNPSTTVNIATADTGAFLLKVTSDQFNTDGNWVGIGLGYSNNYMKMGIIAEAKDNNARGKLHFAVNTSAGSSNASISDAKMTIDNSGNVGIGTASPANKLHVNGGRIQVQNGVSGEIYLRNSSNYVYGDENGVAILAANNNLRLYTAGSDRLHIDSSGNVGIGTTSPVNKLHVFNTGYPQMALQSNGGTWQIGVSTGNDLAFRRGTSGSNYPLWLDSSDNVGIGITSPAEKLHVDGNILVDSILLSNQENTDVDSAAAEMVAQVAIATYTAVFFDFVIKKGTNVRSGTVYACHDGTNVEFTETSTQDLGDTSDVALSVDISSNNIRLVATVTSDDWSIKTLVRAI